MVVRLELGSLSLVEASYPASAPWSINALAEGTQFGNPEAVITAIRSRLQNGSLASVTSYGNREGTVRVQVESATYDGLAAGEAALMTQTQVDGYNTLTWSPNVALARPTVFDVVYSVLSHQFDDLDEVRLRRVFTLQVNTLPFAREQTLTMVQVTAAVPTVTATTVVVNDGSSASGWSATNGSALAASGGVVSTTSVGAPQGAPMSLRKEQSFNIQDFRNYFVFDWRSGSRLGGTGEYAYLTDVNGVDVPLDLVAGATSAPPATGYIRSWFRLPQGYNISSQMSVVRFGLPEMLPGAVLALDQFFFTDTQGVGLAIVDNGSSATGWSTENQRADGSIARQSNVTSVSGAVQASADGRYGPYAVYLNRNVTIDAAATPIVYFDTNLGTDAELVVNTASGGRVTLSPAAFTTSTVGSQRTFFRLPESITGFSFGQAYISHGTTVSVDQVVRTNVEPGGGTLRQRTRTLPIGGSAPCQASLAITAPAGQTLGRGTMIYTRSGSTGFQPNLRPWLVSSGAVTLDTDMVSGARHFLGATSVYRFPAARIRAASHALIGLLRVDATGSYPISWSAKITSVAGADVPESVVVTSGTTSVAMTGHPGLQSFVEVANIHLPTVTVAPDVDFTITLTINGPSTVVVDDFFLLDEDNGALTVVDSEGLTRLEVRTPDLRSPEESVWGGYDPGGTPSHLIRQDYRVKSLGQHTFLPGLVEIFTVTTRTLASALSAMYCRAFHSNVGGSDTVLAATPTTPPTTGGTTTPPATPALTNTTPPVVT